ncbi:MAG TPA: carbon storage regulator CsrA [Bacillota bacterium]|nr:carbon storage regulator CsrA [Bacillota bacterium]HPL54027.1 carbon storage regulator CsrA [Bacillota bacterium]
MLILTRKRDESIIIGDDVEIVISDISEDKVKIGIIAPKHVKVFRKELLEEVKEENIKSALSKDIAAEKLKEYVKKE